MNYKVIEIDPVCDPSVELRFCIAGARADGEELLRLDIPFGENKREHSRMMTAIIRILKQMKEERLIQFFAGEKQFSESSMEAEFLHNKYPSVFLCGLTDNPGADFIYIKL